MRPPAFLVIIPTLVLCGAAFCEQANSQTKQVTKADATVSGKISIKGKPAPGVVVTLESLETGQVDPRHKGTTDQDGNYRINDVRAGRYMVVPQAPSHVIPNLENSKGQSLLISEGENVEGIDFQLVRGGVITGKITDAEGHPLIEEQVNLLPVDQSKQHGPYSSSLDFQTDDRGVYRIFGIRPGHYRVSIGQGSDSFYGSFGSIRPAFRTTFYPDTTDPSKATVVEIGEGTEAKNIDIALTETLQSFSVSGRVMDESGKPVANVSMGLTRLVKTDAINTGSFYGAGGVRSDPRGEFRIEKLPAGKYAIQIYPPAESDLRADQVTFEVVDQDVTGILVKLSIGASLSGVVVVEGTKDNRVLAALPNSSISAYMRINETSIGSSRWSRLRPDGSFRIGGLTAGTANIAFDATQNVSGLTITRIERDGVVQPSGIQLQSGEEVSGIRIVLGYSSGRIRGVVKVENGTLPPNGRLIIQLSKPGERGGTGKGANADVRGHFLLEGLAAGTYELTVIAFIPDRRQAMPTAKQVVTVTEGATVEVIATIDLSPVP